ncbi:SDR family NAD(P)-dependent oxidoreductase [Thermoleophilia bacterium SCSIO 60948]|nr:SDR family NAD(P)-dependent oxidoreductase [Thermoleophilia bacterium SCSIO 60948]
MFDPSPILITGCSTGIGRACAEHLAHSGHKVYATARNADSIADLASSGCETRALDVTDETSMQAVVDEIVEREGRIGALVNNAGYSQSGAVETLDVDALRAQFETNVFGLVRLTQLVLPSMRAAYAGRIVNMSSMGANFVFPGGGAYHASKYAVEALSDALRFEVAGFGVKVALIQPGAIKTEFDKRVVDSLANHRPDSDYDGFNRIVGKVTQEAYEKGPLKWLGGGPETVATVVEKALTDDRPKIRYLVTPSAYVLTLNRKLLGARGWDLFARTQFPRPG